MRDINYQLENNIGIFFTYFVNHELVDHHYFHLMYHAITAEKEIKIYNI